MVGDGDDIKLGVMLYVIEQFLYSGNAIAGIGVHVEVCTSITDSVQCAAPC